jgi:hypothetical protein
MQKFFYQLKARFNGHSWNDRIYLNFVEAKDRKEAKLKINEIFQMELKQRVSRDGEEPEFKLFLIPSDKSFEDFWLAPRTCGICGEAYTIMANRNLGEYATQDTCSGDCRKHKRPPVPEHLETFSYGGHKPVIYKVTHKPTNRVYIGQTTQPVTLRWWQHISAPTDSKFHKAISESSLRC